MVNPDQLRISGLAEGLVGELSDDNSLLSKHLDKTDFLGRNIKKPRHSSKLNKNYISKRNVNYTSKDNKNKSLTARLRKLIFKMIIAKPNAYVLLSAYKQKFPETPEFKPGKAFENTIDNILLPHEERFPIYKKAIIVSFRPHMEAYDAENKNSYINSEGLRGMKELPFKSLKLTPDEKKQLKTALVVKIKKENKEEKDKNYEEDESLEFLLNQFIGDHSSDELNLRSHLPIERCKELEKKMFFIKEKIEIKISRKRHDYGLFKSESRKYKSYRTKHEQKDGEPFGNFIAERLNKTWFSVSQDSKPKSKTKRRPIKEIDGNSRGWNRITTARIIMELGPERYESSDTSVLSKSGTFMEEHFNSYIEAEQAWSNFKQNFTDEDFERSKHSKKKLLWDLEYRVEKRKKLDATNIYNELLRKLGVYKFQQPRGLKNICRGIMDCHKSFNYTPYLSNEGLQYIANEMYCLYLIATKYRVENIDELLANLKNSLERLESKPPSPNHNKNYDSYEPEIRSDSGFE